jgi:hypothetical protein
MRIRTCQKRRKTAFNKTQVFYKTFPYHAFVALVSVEVLPPANARFSPAPSGLQPTTLAQCSSPAFLVAKVSAYS